jgi:hypothetical protein
MEKGRGGENGTPIERPAWSEPRDSPKETEQVAGNEGTSKNASLMKMKSIKDRSEVEERQEMAPLGTVEMKPWSSNQASRDAAHGEVRFPSGLQVSE